MADTDPPSSSSELVTSRARAKILLVDDTYANLVALTGVLESLGQDLVTARSGEEALRRLLDSDFAVILLDVHMPGLDGFQTATLVRKRERSKHTPIIFLTAHLAEPRHVFEGYSHGAVDYLVKPFDADALRSKVRVLVDLHLGRERAKREGERARRLDRLDVERASIERRQRWLDAIPHAILIASFEGGVEMVNACWRSTTGMDLEATRAHGWCRAVHAEDRDDAAHRWRRGLVAGEPFDLDLRIIARDGSVALHRVRSAPELDGQNRPVAWICTATELDVGRSNRPKDLQASRTAQTLPSLPAR